MISLNNLMFAYPASRFTLAIPELLIEQGEKIAFVGPSGSGKTTLLHLLAGILRPASGRIALGQTEITALDDRARRNFRSSHIGLVFQRFELIEYLRVRDNILLPFLINQSLTLTGEIIQSANSIAQEMELGDKLDRWPARLSQGEQQRVAIGRAMIVKPKWILADEPTGSLDPVNKRRIIDLLFRQCQSNGATLIVVTHDTAILDGFDRVVDFAEFHAEDRT